MTARLVLVLERRRIVAQSIYYFREVEERR